MMPRNYRNLQTQAEVDEANRGQPGRWKLGDTIEVPYDLRIAPPPPPLPYVCLPLPSGRFQIFDDSGQE